MRCDSCEGRGQVDYTGDGDKVGDCPTCKGVGEVEGKGEVAFYNVTIVIEGVTPVKAYNALSQALASIESITGFAVEWSTDTYTERDEAGNDIGEPRDASELWGRDE